MAVAYGLNQQLITWYADCVANEFAARMAQKNEDRVQASQENLEWTEAHFVYTPLGNIIIYSAMIITMTSGSYYKHFDYHG